MRSYELVLFAGEKVRGCRGRLLLICLLPIGAEMLFRAAEAAVYSLLLYYGGIAPLSLFTGADPVQIALAASFGLLRLFVGAPLWYAAAFRVREYAGDSDERTSFSKLLLSGRFLFRSMAAAVWSKLAEMLALAPAVISAAFCIELISDGADTRELIIAMNCAAAAIVSLMIWLDVRLRLLAVPFMTAEYPHKSAFGCVMKSLGFMRGRQKMPLMLGLIYLLPMLTIIGIPFVLPELAAAFAIGISIYLKEDEYKANGRNDLYGRLRGSADTASLSQRALRSIKAAPAKAEKP